MNQIFQHSCESMPELSDNSVSLTVTSPPYWNAIDYDIHASDKSQYYRTRAYSNGYAEYSNYLDWIDRIFSEVLRVTKPGGFCGIVIGTVLQDGKHYPVPFDVTSRLAQRGWEFHQDIIWHKTTAGVKRAGVTIQKPYPGYYYPNIMTEYILVFRKPGPAIYQNRSEEEKRAAQYPINRLFTMDVANNVWHIAPVPPDHLEHPCPFPEEIPYRLITMYSYPGELVLDPFVGSGQTPKVASWLERQYVGYEIIAKYVELTQHRIHKPLALRPKQLIAVFDKVGLNDSTVESPSQHRNQRKTKMQAVTPVQPRLLKEKGEYRKR
ncbi:MAG TPA: site-specific DNA-methyltransferase [Anaerolineae bacterium]